MEKVKISRAQLRLFRLHELYSKHVYNGAKYMSDHCGQSGLDIQACACGRLSWMFEGTVYRGVDEGWREITKPKSSHYGTHDMVSREAMALHFALMDKL
jgi:hypothetical protein